MKIDRRTFGVSNCPEKSSRNAARICFLEIGGTKDRGDVLSGICNYRMVRSFVRTNAMAFGKSTAFMTNRNRISNRESWIAFSM
jgi:hypothetical protein